MDGYMQLCHMYDEARRAELEHVTVYERYMFGVRETMRKEQPLLDLIRRPDVDMPLLWEGMD